VQRSYSELVQDEPTDLDYYQLLALWVTDIEIIFLSLRALARLASALHKNVTIFTCLFASCEESSLCYSLIADPSKI
jgi:hypothetical protein